MGWTYTRGYTKKDMIDYLLRTYSCTFGSTKVIAHAVVGNELYAVIEGKWTDSHKGFFNEVVRSIHVFLLDHYKIDGVTSWGYKVLNEVDEPYYYQCPIEFFKLAGDYIPNWYPTARKWREDVVAVHNKIKSVDEALKFITKEARKMGVKMTRAQAKEILREAQANQKQTENKTTEEEEAQ